jgi:hypothetical protein
MKKIIVAAVLMASVLAVKANDVTWSWWCDNKQTKTDLSFGIGAQCLAVDTLEVSAIYGASPSVGAFQWSVFGINNSKMDGCLQLAPWANIGGKPCVQLSFFVNMADQTVFTMGFLNFAKTSSKVQLGFLNFNKNGFLPVFPFINLDKSLFE